MLGFIIVLVILGLLIGCIIAFNIFMIKEVYVRNIINDDGEFYRVLSKFPPEKDKIHKRKLIDRNYVIITRKITYMRRLKNLKEFKKVSEEVVSVDYYICD